MSTFVLRLFGSPVLAAAEAGTVVPTLGAKPLALLTFLTLEPRPHSREALAGLLWGESPEAEARASLRQALKHLRETLGAAIHADFDFRQTGLQTWDIRVDTSSGVLVLSMGGSTLAIDGTAVDLAGSQEYPSLYARFAELVRKREIDVDVGPLQLVADAFLCGRRTVVEPFIV